MDRFYQLWSSCTDGIGFVWTEGVVHLLILEKNGLMIFPALNQNFGKSQSLKEGTRILVAQI